MVSGPGSHQPALAPDQAMMLSGQTSLHGPGPVSDITQQRFSPEIETEEKPISFYGRAIIFSTINF